MINDNLEMAKIEMDIERLENELLPEDFDLMQLRGTDNTIHWTLKALVVYTEDLQKAGIWADELPEAVELLTMNLEANINIMVYETTGFDACDFADNKDITEEEIEWLPLGRTMDEIDTK